MEEWLNEIYSRGKIGETTRKTYPDSVSSSTKPIWSDRDANSGPQRWEAGPELELGSPVLRALALRTELTRAVTDSSLNWSLIFILSGLMTDNLSGIMCYGGLHSQTLE